MTKVKMELDCLKDLLKREPIVKVVEELPEKETADLNYIYVVPKDGEGKDTKAYVLRPDRSGFDTIDLTPQLVNVLGEGYITVEKETLNENGDVTFTVKTNETFTNLLTEIDGKDQEQDVRLNDVTHRVVVLENRPNNGTTYDDTELKGRVKALEDKPEPTPYNDKPLSDRVTALEGRPQGTSYDDTAISGRITQLETSVTLNKQEQDAEIVDLKRKDMELEGKITTLETKADRDNQTLALDGNTLTISNGNSVTLPSSASSAISAYSIDYSSNIDAFIKGNESFTIAGDSSFPSAEKGKLEALTYGNGLYFRTRHSDGTVIARELKDSDDDNQELSIQGHTLSISEGNSVELPEETDPVFKEVMTSLFSGYTEGTTDFKEWSSSKLSNLKYAIYANTEEVNNLKKSKESLENKNVELTKSVSDNKSETDTKVQALDERLKHVESKEDADNQTLTLDGNTLIISKGNSVELPTYNDSHVQEQISGLKSDVDSLKQSTPGNTTTYTLAEKDEGISLKPSDSYVEFPKGTKRYPTNVEGIDKAPLLLRDAYSAPISVLNGKKIYFVGDSLTEVNYRTNKGYVESLKQDKYIDAVNHGTSGYGYQTKDDNFLGTDADTSDAFVIFLGINDFGNVSGYKLPLSAVLKSAKVLISKAVIQSKDRPVGVILPMNNINTLNDAIGAGGYSLKQLVDGLKQVVKDVEAQYNRTIPVLDLFNLDPLNIKGVTDTTKAKVAKEFFTNNNNEDKELLHPNNNGWEIITKYISYWLENTFEFNHKRPDEKTLQVVKLNNGNLEINSTTSPIKYDSTETNAFNKNKFRIPVFGDDSYTYSLRGDYTDKSKYKLTYTVNDYFTFDTDYHPVATDYNQLFFYFDVDSITTNPAQYLADNDVKTVMASRNCDEKEAKYILNLVKLYKEYQDRQIFVSEDIPQGTSFTPRYVPFPLKITIEKR